MISRDLRSGLERRTTPLFSFLRALPAAGIALLCALSSLPAAWAAAPPESRTIDRIAAVVDQQVITVSEIDQMVAVRFFPRQASTSEDDYRHDVLESLIAQALQLRYVQRFGVQDIPKDSIEARLTEMEKRFASPAEFAAAAQRAELSIDDVRALIKRQLQVEGYIQDRFAPLIYISNEDIQTYYSTTWSQQRRERGLAVPPLADVREEIRSLLKSTRLQTEIEEWTAQLRARANVDVFTWRT